ncbi:two-component system phosphate regulon sensor histidine kinase PhoR [Saonia flava]|uniref:histidine kinase n=1 Tax=Saonia flava TaxID=523696 RepID=A0A846QWR8_9FLAO|nr:HAMP domain-containing sensor histidine kinase [Saonia flava]NJB70713.1 two-component system phosphate regulon sensor histidine kinase PhoR [Saonia flava]
MKKKNIYIIVFIVSILGLAIVQYQYLRVGLNLAKVQFNIKIGTASETIKEELKENNRLTFLIGEAIREDQSYFELEIDSLKDASSHFLNDYLTERMVNNGIDADFTYGLFARDSTYYLKSPATFNKENNIAVYPIQLEGYLPELLNERLILELQFESLNSYFLSKLNGLTLPSLLFILGIIATVFWVLRTYYWQRNVITTTNEFINNLTHELKTPVFSIGLASKMLEEEIGDENNPKIAIIRQEVERLKNHIDKVLELGSLEAKKRVFTLVKMDFEPNIKKLCSQFKTLSSIENVSFSYDLDEGPYCIKTEASHLENSINNILDNAKKYSKNPIINLKAKKKNGKLQIIISDNGKGIDEKDKNRIFQKYYRVLNGNTYEVKGYGLGLSYVKKVVENHKGKIMIESEVGMGTTVLIEIPLNKNGKKV